MDSISAEPAERQVWCSPGAHITFLGGGLRSISFKSSVKVRTKGPPSHLCSHWINHIFLCSLWWLLEIFDIRCLCFDTYSQFFRTRKLNGRNRNRILINNKQSFMKEVGEVNQSLCVNNFCELFFLGITIGIILSFALINWKCK